MATTYHELILQGPTGRGLGFIEGYLAGRDLQGRVINAEEAGFACQPFREKVRELLQPSRETLHLLVPARVLSAVRRAVEASAEIGVGLEVVGEREVLAARFSFRFSIYSKEHADRIRAFFEELPDGVTLSTEDGFREEIHPENKGIESYAPVHDYELSAKGTVEGEVEGVLALYRLCADEELVQADAPEIVEA